MTPGVDLKRSARLVGIISLVLMRLVVNSMSAWASAWAWVSPEAKPSSSPNSRKALTMESRVRVARPGRRQTPAQTRCRYFTPPPPPSAASAPLSR